MANYSTNQFKAGLKIMLDGQPCNIVENEFVKPGKGQAFNRVKIRNLLNGRVIDKTFKSGDSVEAADVVEVEMEYLYSDGEQWHFMDPSNYEQIAVNENALGDTIKWLKPQAQYIVTLWNNNAISFDAPNFVELQVVATDPGLKGDTVSGGSKPATLETGAVVQVPLFINENDKLKIDTRSGIYVSRAK